jgi:DNA gyrase subunit A
MKRFKLSTIQAQAILDLPLKRLASLERKKIEMEYKELIEQIKELQGILKSEIKRRKVVEEELAEIKAKYADRRRTQIIKLKKGKAVAEIPVLKDVIPTEKVWLTISKGNQVRKFRESNDPRLGGKDAPKILVSANSSQTLYLVNTEGKCAAINIQAIPFCETTETSIPLIKISAFSEKDSVISAFCLTHAKKHSENVTVLTITKLGLIKRSLVSDLPGPSADLFTLVKVNEGDEVLSVRVIIGEPELMVITETGMGIRFESQEVRTMGFIAAGVNALKLAGGDKVVSIHPLSGKGELLAVGSDGSGWRVEERLFPKQGRYGAGVIGFKMNPKTYIVGVGYGKKNHQVSIHLDKSAAKVIRIDEIPAGKRAAVGKKLVEVKLKDKITAIVESQDFSEIDESKTRLPIKKRATKK